jgi:restriction endonuclease S subunit
VSEVKSLRPGWKIWRFDQMATNVNVRIDKPSDSGMEHYVGLEHLDADSLKIRRWGTPNDVEATKLMFKSGDIIFGRRRAYQRKLGVAEFNGICSAHAMVLRAKPDVVIPEFLPFFMQSDLFMNRAVEISVGSLSPTINWKTLAVQEFALPCLEEQAKLIELLSASLSAAYAAEMVSIRVGELRKSFIADHLGNGLDVSSGVNTPWGTLPLHWRYIPVGDVTSSSAYGPRFPSTLYAVAGNARTIRTTDFCGIDGINLTTAPAAKLNQGMVEEHALCDGDFLLSRSGEYAGKTRVFSPVGEDRFIPAAFLIRYRLSQGELRPKYLHYICSSPIGQSVLSSLVQGSAQPNIAGSAFAALRIPVPPIQEQDEVIALLDDLSNADRMANERLTRSRALMGAVLADMQEVQRV